MRASVPGSGTGCGSGSFWARAVMPTVKPCHPSFWSVKVMLEKIPGRRLVPWNLLKVPGVLNPVPAEFRVGLPHPNAPQPELQDLDRRSEVDDVGVPAHHGKHGVHHRLREGDRLRPALVQRDYLAWRRCVRHKRAREDPGRAHVVCFAPRLHEAVGPTVGDRDGGRAGRDLAGGGVRAGRLPVGPADGRRGCRAGERQPDRGGRENRCQSHSSSVPCTHLTCRLRRRRPGCRPAPAAVERVALSMPSLNVLMENGFSDTPSRSVKFSTLSAERVGRRAP